MALEQESPILNIDEATVYRGDTKVLDRFSMSINRLEHTAIVGPNGSGKSTFIQLLTHQLHPVVRDDEAQTVRILGREKWIVSELRKRLGIVSADLEYQIVHNLKNGHLSGREVVLSGFFSSMQLFRHQKVTDHMYEGADRALALMEAGYLSEQTFGKMSAGEKRRVLIARALVTDPDMLVLDEPTTSLDFVARQTCLQLIRKLTREGTTVIIVTHHIEEIIPEIEKVILLKGGRVAYAGSKGDVLNSRNLSSVFEHPVTLSTNGESYHIKLDLSQY